MRIGLHSCPCQKHNKRQNSPYFKLHANFGSLRETLQGSKLSVCQTRRKYEYKEASKGAIDLHGGITIYQII
jgi:hypothetical protein